jgi:hypothetical protein
MRFVPGHLRGRCDQRESDAEILDGSVMGIDEPSEVNKPCRFCELACPIAQ